VTRPTQVPRHWRLRRWFLLLIASSTVIVGVWRFASTSLQVDALAPYIERAFTSAAPGLEVDIGTLEVTWGGWRRGIDLVARDTRVVAGDVDVTVPDFLIKLSLRALLRGRIAPTVVEVLAVTGKVVRERDGTIRLLALRGDREQAFGTPVLERLLADLAAPPDPERPFTYLQRLCLRDATFTIEDRGLEVTWNVSRIDVDLYAINTEVAGEFRASVLLDEQQAELDGTLAFDASANVFRVLANFAGITVDALSSRVERIRALVRLRSLVGGSFAVGVNLSGALEDLAFELDFTPGLITVPGWLDEPQPFRELHVGGRFDGATGTWRLEPARLALGDAAQPGPTLFAAADIDLGGDTPGIDAEVGIDDVDVAALPGLWPAGVEEASRNWIANHVGAGRIDELRSQFRIAWSRELEATPHVAGLTASFRFDDLRVRWSDKAPAVTALRGTASFAEHALRFEVERGRVGAVELDGGTVDLLDLDRKPGRIEINVTGAGPLGETLEAVLLRPPDFVHLHDAAGEPTPAFVEFRGRVAFAIQKKKVNFSHLTLAVDAKVRGARIESDLVTGLAGGTLRFDSDGKEKVLGGTIDLRDLGSELAVLGWTKEPGEEGTARFELKLGEGHPEALRSFAVETPTLRATGTARFNSGDGRLRSVEFSNLESGRTRLQRARIEWEDDETRVALGDGSVDLLPVFAAPETLASPQGRKTLNVTASGLSPVWVDENGWLDDLSGAMRRGANGWQLLKFDARVPAAWASREWAQGAAVQMTIEPATSATLSAKLTTEDLGGLMRLIGWGTVLRGGSLSLAAQDLSPGLDRGHLRVEARRFSVADTPLGVRLLSMASLESLVNTLQGENLFFDELDGDIEMDSDTVRLAEVRAHGSSLGWVTRGTIDRSSGEIALSGILIPAYTANRFLHAVPVLREVIVGEGILSVDFEIGGTLEEPELETHPMSAITPELLRRVFGGGGAR